MLMSDNLIYCTISKQVQKLVAEIFNVFWLLGDFQNLSKFSKCISNILLLYTVFIITSWLEYKYVDKFRILFTFLVSVQTMCPTL